MTEEREDDLTVNNDLQIEGTTPDMYEKNEEEAKPEEAAETVNYAEVVKSDIITLSEEFPELASLSDICELDNPIRYAALRDLGLSPAEAYLATAKRGRARDNRSHLYPSPMVASSHSARVPERDMAAAREIFSDMSDADIRRLYKKVTR